MHIDIKRWLIPGICLVLVVSLGFNTAQALNSRTLHDDALSALGTDVDSALADLDSVVYLDNSRTSWNDQSFCSSLYNGLLRARDEASASAQLASLNSGDPAAVASSMGELQERLDATYLPAAERLVAGQASDADQTSLENFCESIRNAGWPLRAQLRDSGWGKLRSSLDALSQSLGPVSSVTAVMNIPDYSGDQQIYSSSTQSTESQLPGKKRSSSSITVKIGTASGA